MFGPPSSRFVRKGAPGLQGRMGDRGLLVRVRTVLEVADCYFDKRGCINSNESENIVY